MGIEQLWQMAAFGVFMFVELHFEKIQQFVDDNSRPHDGLEYAQNARPEIICMLDEIDQRTNKAHAVYGCGLTNDALAPACVLHDV
jgi:hypothetical protein